VEVEVESPREERGSSRWKTGEKEKRQKIRRDGEDEVATTKPTAKSGWTNRMLRTWLSLQKSPPTPFSPKLPPVILVA